MKFILASGNKHKVLEFQELFQDSSIEVIPAPKILEVEESGETYLENALLKAQAYYREFQLPILSDDSGLQVEALPHILGVKSARFEPELSQDGKNKKIIELLAEEKNLLAFFTAQLCFYQNPQEIFFFEGILRGKISDCSLGTGGFGYDPIFIPEGEEKTLSEMPDWKALHSHRAKAVKEALKFWKKLV